jgi:hypothetical protein
LTNLGMIRLTNAAIDEQRTERGGWTAAQLAALDVPWPPPKGWKRRLVGTYVTEEQWQAFCHRGDRKRLFE